MMQSRKLPRWFQFDVNNVKLEGILFVLEAGGIFSAKTVEVKTVPCAIILF